MFPHTANCELVTLLGRDGPAAKEANRTLDKKVERCTAGERYDEAAEPSAEAAKQHDPVQLPAGTLDGTMGEMCNSKSSTSGGVPAVANERSGDEQTNVEPETRPESSVLNCNKRIDEKEVKKTTEQTAEETAERSTEQTAERSAEVTEDTTEQTAKETANQAASAAPVDEQGEESAEMVVEHQAVEALEEQGDDPEKATKRARIV